MRLFVEDRSQRRARTCSLALIALLSFYPKAVHGIAQGVGTDPIDPIAGELGSADSTVSGNTGQAQWSIPIEVPPGPGGFQPSVAIRYSSGAGDGPFGVGWSLPLGAVECSVRKGVPAYIVSNPAASCPRFELDGELLNFSGPSGSSGSYHTFVESFQRILHKSNDVWEVTGTDGMIRRYGETANSRIIGPSGNVARWLLSSLENPWGQRIVFEYDANPGTALPDDPDDLSPPAGYTYLSSISYGPGQDRVIAFIYDDRPDPIYDFKGGVQRYIGHRGTEVVVTNGAHQHSRYLIGYDLPGTSYTTSRSRLSWVQRFGASCTSSDPVANCAIEDGKALPAQEFRYTDPGDVTGPQWERDDIPGTGKGWLTNVPLDEGAFGAWPYVFPAAARFGDVNGDGLIDLIWADEADGWVYPGPSWEPLPIGVALNTGTGFAYSQFWTDAINELRFDAPRVDMELVELAFGSHHYAVCDATYSTVPMRVYVSDTENLAPLNIQFPWGPEGTIQPYPNPYVQLGGNFHLIDLTGDGRVELVMSQSLSGVHKTHDCSGNELSSPEYVEPVAGEVRVVFRNTGSGWELDPSLAQGLPLFGKTIVDSGWAIVHIWGDEENYDCFGYIGRTFRTDAPDWFTHPVHPCIAPTSYDPVFTDLNGDGRVDLIVAEPSLPNTLIMTAFPGDSVVSVEWARPKSVAYIAQEGGGWVRDSSFDPPFLHAMFNYYPTGSGSWQSAGDTGVRFADLNRDGYSDITFVNPYQDTAQPYCAGQPCPDQPLGYPSAPRGVLLNQGSGDGSPYSAWCSSRPLAVDTVEPPVSIPLCDQADQASRFELPEGQRFAIFNAVASTFSFGTELGDVNGDGWLDLIRAQSPIFEPQPPTTYLFNPGGGSPWLEAPIFAPPTNLGRYYASGLWRQHNSRVHDLDADGAVDFLIGLWRDSASWVGNRGLSDLLREVRNGRGGAISLTYDSGTRQRSADLEQDAQEHSDPNPATPEPGDEPLGDVGQPRWTTSPVVTSVTVDGPNREVATTQYRYADSRWCPEERSELGYRLVEMTLPDQETVVASFFYQKHGRAGRLSERTTWAGASPLQSVVEEWIFPPGPVAGAWYGDAGIGSEASHLARLARREVRNEYGASLGALVGATHVETFLYDDTYGYNFVSRIAVDRPSGSIDRHRIPEPMTSRHVLGLVAEAYET